MSCHPRSFSKFVNRIGNRNESPGNDWRGIRSNREWANLWRNRKMNNIWNVNQDGTLLGNMECFLNKIEKRNQILLETLEAMVNGNRH